MLDGKPELGDRVKQALNIVGIDQGLMERVLGHECKCDDRQEMLNQLDRWARRVLRGQLDQAVEFLERMKR